MAFEMEQTRHPNFQIRTYAIAITILLASLGTAYSQDEAALAKAAQNPVANMISLPLQNNLDFGVGPNETERNVLNIQPVYPMSVNEDWNLITRTIAPIIYQKALAPGMDNEFGLGDVSFTGFFSPAKASDITWGVGPVLTFPTATESALGSGKFGAGPSVVVLTMPGNWVVGCLLSNVWSYAGWGDDDVNFMTFQYFINYNLEAGWYLTSAPIITANWESTSGGKWTVPFGGGIGRIFKMGNQPVNAQVSAYYNVEKPEYGADWQLRLQLQFLFPR